MTIREAIDKIISQHAPINEAETVDTIKCGYPEDELKGIVTTCCASVAVIREAIRLGANLIVTHEPVFYSHQDETEELEGNTTYEAKLALCEENRITIWRDHDHMHADHPDSIMVGVIKALGWEKYYEGDWNQLRFSPAIFRLPEMKLQDVAEHIKKSFGLEKVKCIGNPDCVVRSACFFAHIMAGDGDMPGIHMMNREDIDLLIPGEVIDWTTASNVRDAAQLGKNKAMLVMGHFNLEEPGMAHAAQVFTELFEGKVPVKFVRSGDMFFYL